MVFANLKPRKLVDFLSDGMVMCSSSPDGNEFELIRPPPNSKIGERVQLVGNPCAGQPLSQEVSEKLNPKKEIHTRFMKLLKTNDSGVASFNGVELVTS